MQIFKLFSILLIVLSVYLNFKIFNNYKVQVGIINDFNTNEFRSDNFVKLKNLDISFPNLTGTAFPLYIILAKYHITFNEFNEAIEILNKYSNNNVNPFLKVKESLKAEIYWRLGIRDSAYFYSKEAYINLPKNIRHFEQYIQELVLKKDINEIKNVFNESNAKEDKQFWRIYLTSVFNIRDLLGNEIENQANIALKKFYNDPKIKTISAMILYGQENISKSYELYSLGLAHFDKNEFGTASEKFIEAIALNPVDYTFYENTGMALIKDKKFQKAIPFLEKVIEGEFNPRNGKSEYGLGVIYSYLEDTENACKFFTKAMALNYKPAFYDHSKVCIN